MPQAGDNSAKIANGYIDRIVPYLADIAAAREEIRDELKAAIKDGLNSRALLKAAQEKAMPEEKREKQLAFEFALHDYRRAAGLPTEIAGESQEAA